MLRWENFTGQTAILDGTNRAQSRSCETPQTKFMSRFPNPRRKSRPFAKGDVVDVMVAKGLNPNGGWARATIELDVSSQFGKGMWMVRFEEDSRLDHIHELRFALVEATEERANHGTY